jgi:hypothetical protein
MCDVPLHYAEIDACIRNQHCAYQRILSERAALCSERSAPVPKAVVLVVSIICSSLVLLTFMQAGSQTA